MASLYQMTARLGRRGACHFAGPARCTPNSIFHVARLSTAPAIGDASSSKEGSTLPSPKLQSLYDEIAKLPEEEVNILGALVIQVLGRNIFPGEFRPVAGAVAAGGAPIEEEEEATETRTTFDLKLMGFDAKAKIKVIKEVRAIAGLGLKEAKEVVESAPKVIQKDLKQEKADELKIQLESVGAQVEIV